MDMTSLGMSSMKRKQSGALLSSLGKNGGKPPTTSPIYATNTSSSSPKASLSSPKSPQDGSSLSPTDLVSPRTASSSSFSFAGSAHPSSRNVSAGSIGGPMSSASSISGVPSSSGGGRGSTGLVVRRPEDVYRIVRDRLFSWSYLMQWYQGDVHWFDAVKIPRTALEASLGPSKVDSRARSYFLLGASLSPLFDIGSLPDFLRSLLKLLDEWEGTEGGARQGVKNLFRGQRTGRRVTGGPIADISAGPSDAESLLLQIHLPFSPDFFQIHASTCSIVRDIYKKILGMVLPPPPPSAPALPTLNKLFHSPTSESETDSLFHPSTFIHSAPLESPAPHFSSLSPSSSTASAEDANLSNPLSAFDQQAPPTTKSDGRISATQNDAFQALVAGELPSDRTLVGEGQKLTPQVVEMFIKVDAKLKKHLSNLLREGDGLARKILDDELNVLAASITSGAPLKFDYRAAMSGSGGDWAGSGEWSALAKGDSAPSSSISGPGSATTSVSGHGSVSSLGGASVQSLSHGYRAWAL